MKNLHHRRMAAASGHGSASRFAAFAIGLMAVFCSISSVSGVNIENKPLTVGSSVPGNLVLVPSVEYPTIHSQANIGNYDATRRYSGYFDPDKCYAYHYSATESERHFYPVGLASSFNCPTAGQWSGNYMNWAATQTIDPFRLALTGGYRVKDEPGETWLEKARHAPGYGLYPNRRLPASGNNATLVANVTAAQWDNLTVRIEGLGNKMRFSSSGNLDNTPTAYNPAIHLLTKGVAEQSHWESCREGQQGCQNNGTRRNPRWERKVVDVAAVPSDAGTVYEVSVRVKVCDASVGVESNCKQYAQGWKPEGLIQEYAERIRYSIFGFLNETGNQRNGGVMRARQKFVGPYTNYPELGRLANVNSEWNSSTGVLVRNPDPDDANGTGFGVADSGVINYLNKFGQMTGQNPKGNDPVSELYYAALRYFRGQGNLADYTNNLDYNKADGFPVITNWDDPIRYSCQVNAALGIGDVYTHADHDLPSDDKTLAQQYTKRVFQLEGINKEASAEFSGRGNSAYIAGLAYYAHTNDLRPDDAAKPNTKGMQTLSTYWVDVRENQRLEPKTGNQYWLAAKYGGFRVPSGFRPLTDNLPAGSWHTSGEYLTAGANGGVTSTVTDYPRPDNFYVASEADKMVESLRAAFRKIVDDASGSASSFASNTTKLEVGARTYQAKYISNGWAGRLTASDVDTATGNLTDIWDASDWLGQAAGDLKVNANATTLNYTQRQILYNNSGTLANFITNWTGNTLTSPTLAKPGAFSTLNDNQLKYILGDRTHERQSTVNGSLRTFRDRRGMLGDIINSTPVYVGRPNANLYAGDASYATFVSQQSSRTPVVYVGANDGMLHAFKAPDSCTGANAECGKELFAFMPTEAMGVLTQNDPSTNKYPYWHPEYDHAYSVDGELTVADVKHNGTWKTILVGTMGRGGKSIFALDVTDPASPSLLWEKTASDPAIGSLLGNALGRPIIAKVADNDWRVFIGNGPNSSSGESVLIMLNAVTGANANTKSTGADGDNGLSGVNVWDDHGTVIPSKPDGNFDTVYAGDMNGNLWKFDLDNNTVTRLFTTQAGQPITAAPLVAKNPYNPPETWVFFGTGRYLSTADTSSTANQVVQSWYGIIDRDAAVTRATLSQSRITHQDSVGRVIEKVGAPGTNGWYIDLQSPAEAAGGTPKGERMVVPNFFQGMALIGTTRYPDSTDPCSPTGRGYTMAIDPFTGGRLGSAFFDMNGNGTVGDSGDYYGGNTSTPYSGVGYDSGPNNPIFLGPYMYTSLDSGSYSKIMTSGAQALVRRVSWRELLNAN